MILTILNYKDVADEFKVVDLVNDITFINDVLPAVANRLSLEIQTN
ncbi:MAG: hypothetical protein ACI884_002348 [Ulvibacter sp.]